MSRVIWLSGSPGAGTSTLALASHAALVDAGERACLVDASADVEALVDPAPWGAALAIVARDVGADPVVPESWSGLSWSGLVTAWRSVARAAAQGEAVVVDGGCLARTRDLVVLPGIAGRLIDALLTPRGAMWRSQEGLGHVDALAAMRDEVAQWSTLLEAEGTTARLLARPEPAQARRVLRGAALLAMHGLEVEGLVASRVPRRKEACTPAVRREAEAAVAALEDGAQGCAVWRSTSRVRPAPKGRAVGERLTSPEVIPAVRPTTVDLTADDDAFLLDLPLREPARRGARLGITSRSVVLGFEGTYRWWVTPALLQRCRVVDARRTPDGWQVRWEPDASVWPSSSGDPADDEGSAR